jgi:CRP-like cAMP-binding protein
MRCVDGARKPELQPIIEMIRVIRPIARGECITDVGNSQRQLIVLLDGIACSYERLEDGRRQIFLFQYPGDFCGLHRYLWPTTSGHVSVAALTDCKVGMLEYRVLDKAMESAPAVATALWRAIMLDASILRERMNVSRRSALERVAHLLCEHLHRREAIGSGGAIIPLTQIDVADAVGISVTHVNRVFQELRKLGVLSEKSRVIEVVNSVLLADKAKFDDRYLHMSVALSGWTIDTR